MKNLALILLFMFATNYIQAQQNLIYNGDFELFDSCPNAISIPGDIQIEKAFGWVSPTAGTSDYFNICNSGFVSVPNNILGYQQPQSGQAYAGLVPVSNTDGFWYEYIQTKLVKTLEINKKYKLSFFINVANYENDYFLKDFGAFFSEQQISKADAKPFNNVIPQVYYSGNSFITDTVNWIRIEGDFIANGSEQYLTIGMFKDSTNFDTLCNNQNNFPCDYNEFTTYYYIDNIQLFDVNQNNTPNIFTPNGDGYNDIWKPLFNSVDEVFEIFNRWGNKIYIVNFQNKGWNGKTTSDNDCSDGVYFYISTTNQKGTIQLIR